jgi:hypothetical protein
MKIKRTSMENISGLGGMRQYFLKEKYAYKK